MGIEEFQHNQRLAQAFIQAERDEAYRQRLVHPDRHAAAPAPAIGTDFGGSSAIGYVGATIGHTVVAPVASASLAKWFVKAGMRDPKQVMWKANQLLIASRWYYCLMVSTGFFALLAMAVSAGSMNQMAHHVYSVRHDNMAIYVAVLVASVWWLWMLRVINGAILHAFFKKLPNQIYKYVWFWPATTRSPLRIFSIPSMLQQDAPTKEKVVYVGGTILWFLTVKLPLLLTFGFVAFELVTMLGVN